MYVCMYVSVNGNDDEQHSPMHFCCKAGHLAVLNFLLQNGAEPHTANMYGDTPMHL